MASSFERYNDGSKNPPRLRVQHSLWSLEKLPMNSLVEWPLDEKFMRVKTAGFEAVASGHFSHSLLQLDDRPRKLAIALLSPFYAPPSATCTKQMI